MVAVSFKLAKTTRAHFFPRLLRFVANLTLDTQFDRTNASVPFPGQNAALKLTYHNAVFEDC